MMDSPAAAVRTSLQPEAVRSANFNDACLPASSSQLRIVRPRSVVMAGSAVPAPAGEAIGSSAMLSSRIGGVGCCAVTNGSSIASGIKAIRLDFTHAVYWSAFHDRQSRLPLVAFLQEEP